MSLWYNDCSEREFPFRHRNNMSKHSIPPEGTDKPVIVHGLRLDNLTPIYCIADMIYQDWKNISPHALPYLRGMSGMSTVKDYVGFDPGKEVILYFLVNATSWRGDVARAVKTHLKLLIQQP